MNLDIKEETIITICVTVIVCVFMLRACDYQMNNRILDFKAKQAEVFK